MLRSAHCNVKFNTGHCGMICFISPFFTAIQAAECLKYVGIYRKSGYLSDFHFPPKTNAGKILAVNFAESLQLIILFVEVTLFRSVIIP